MHVKYGGSINCETDESQSHIRCIICKQVVDDACVDTKSPNANWTCHKCRTLAMNIQDIVDDLKFACREIHNVKINLINANAHITQLDTKLAETTQELISLRETNTQLVKQIDSQNIMLGNLNTDLTQFKKGFEQRNNERKQDQPSSTWNISSSNPVLVVGDSTVRDLHSDNQNKLMIRTLPGAKISGVKDHIAKLARVGKRFSAINIVAGTNNCSLSNQSTEKILEDTLQTLECASNIADKVVLSSILPRTDDGAALLKLENTNPRLRDLCLRMPKVTFVNHDKNFRLSDRTPNRSFLSPDGLHLNHTGSAQLINNLGIQATVKQRRRHNSKQSYSQPSQQANPHEMSSQLKNINALRNVSVPLYANYYHPLKSVTNPQTFSNQQWYPSQPSREFYLPEAQSYRPPFHPGYQQPQNLLNNNYQVNNEHTSVPQAWIQQNTYGMNRYS